MKGRAIRQAYADSGALTVTCPNCGAAPEQWCTRPDGRVRCVPCVDRATASGAVEAPRRPRDFTQPNHPPERKT
jgi:hypothetical protein